MKRSNQRAGKRFNEIPCSEANPKNVIVEAALITNRALPSGPPVIAA